MFQNATAFVETLGIRVLRHHEGHHAVAVQTGQVAHRGHVDGLLLYAEDPRPVIFCSEAGVDLNALSTSPPRYRLD